jgi:hypothetical protein
VVVVAVPVVPQPWFSPRRRWCSVSQVVVGRSAYFHCPFPSLALVLSHVFVVVVLVMSSFGCILPARLPGAPPRLASFSWPCLVVTAIRLLPLTRRLGSAWCSATFSLPRGTASLLWLLLSCCSVTVSSLPFPVTVVPHCRRWCSWWCSPCCWSLSLFLIVVVLLLVFVSSSLSLSSLSPLMSCPRRRLVVVPAHCPCRRRCSAPLCSGGG